MYAATSLRLVSLASTAAAPWRCNLEWVRFAVARTEQVEVANRCFRPLRHLSTPTIRLICGVFAAVGAGAGTLFVQMIWAKSAWMILKVACTLERAV